MTCVAASEAGVRPGPPPWDLWIVMPAAALSALGLVLVYSSSAVWAARQHQDAAHFLRLQAGWLALGALGVPLVARLPRRLLARRGGWPLAAACLLCALVLVPSIGHWVGGARRWLVVGGVGCQPAEAAKLAVVLFLAASMARQVPAAAAAGQRPMLWGAALAVQLPVLLILLEPDLGTVVVIELVTSAMLYTAGLRPRTLVVLLLTATPCLYHLVVGTPFRLRRMISFIDPWAHRSTSGYQVTEALISLGSGGMAGRGLGQGRQKLFFLPEAHTDFVFASLGEELGLAGVVVVIGLFAALVGRGLQLAARAGDWFDRFLAVGLSAMLGLPAALNAAVAMGLMPTKGLPLPFVSYGGSHILGCMTSVGLLLGVARRTAEARHLGA